MNRFPHALHSPEIVPSGLVANRSGPPHSRHGRAWDDGAPRGASRPPGPRPERNRRGLAFSETAGTYEEVNPQLEHVASIPPPSVARKVSSESHALHVGPSAGATAGSIRSGRDPSPTEPPVPSDREGSGREPLPGERWKIVWTCPHCGQVPLRIEAVATTYSTGEPHSGHARVTFFRARRSSPRYYVSSRCLRPSYRARSVGGRSILAVSMRDGTRCAGFAGSRSRVRTPRSSNRLRCTLRSGTFAEGSATRRLESGGRPDANGGARHRRTPTSPIAGRLELRAARGSARISVGGVNRKKVRIPIRGPVP